MKRMSATMCSTIIILAITGSTTAQSAQPTTLESELRDVLQRRWNALTRKDAKAYGALLDDDVLVPDNGSVYDKKTLIERVATIKETSTEPRDLRVHGDNHAAVIVYRTTSHVLLAGQEITEELRVVESYAKRNGRWLLTARAESERFTHGVGNGGELRRTVHAAKTQQEVLGSVERFFEHHLAASAAVDRSAVTSGNDRSAVIRNESEAPAHASRSQQQPFHLETARGA